MRFSEICEEWMHAPAMTVLWGLRHGNSAFEVIDYVARPFQQNQEGEGLEEGDRTSPRCFHSQLHFDYKPIIITGMIFYNMVYS